MQVECIRFLEAEVANLKAWEAEKHRYEMKEVWPGAVGYVLKGAAQGDEPIHWLVRCYNDGNKELLQLSGKSSDQAGRHKGWECPTCKSNIFVQYDVRPGKDAPAQ